MTNVIPVLKQYGDFRGSSDVEKRDKVVDALAISAAATFADGHSYSPMFRFSHPKADFALVDVAVLWESDHPDSPKIPASPDSLLSRRLLELEESKREYWERRRKVVNSDREKRVGGLPSD